MFPYIIEKNGILFFRRNFPAPLRPQKSSTFFLVKSLYRATSKETGRNARVFEIFSSFVFEQIGLLVQLGAVHMDTGACQAIRRGMKQVFAAWLDCQQLEKARLGPLTPDQIMVRQREADEIVRQSQDALRANNPEIIADILIEGMKQIGLDVSDTPEWEHIANYEGLVAFNQAAILNAERERGHFREHFAAGAGPNGATNVVAFPAPPLRAGSPITPSSAQVSFAAPPPKDHPAQAKQKVDEFSEWFSRFAQDEYAVPGGNKRNEGRKVKDPKSIADFVNMRAEFIEVCGDKAITEYTHQDIRQYIEWLEQVPAMNGKCGKNGSKRDHKIIPPSLQEQIEAADEKDLVLRKELDDLIDAEELRESEAELIWEEKSIRRLKSATINKRLSRLAKLFSYARRELRMKSNMDLVDHIKPNRLTEDPVPSSYRKLSDDEIDLVLSHETYAVPQGWPEAARLKGVQTLSQFGYWAILFSFFSGMRLEEIGQMRVQDVKRRHGVTFIQVRDSAVQSIKNDNANREVPVPQIILDLGFLDLIEERRKFGKPRDWLFDELERDARGKRTATFSKSYGRWRHKIGLCGPGKDFHAGRATFDTHGLNHGTSAVIMAAILGHRLDGDTVATYNKGIALSVMKEAIDQITYGYEVVKDGDTRVLAKRIDYEPLFPNETIEPVICHR